MAPAKRAPRYAPARYFVSHDEKSIMIVSLLITSKLVQSILAGAEPTGSQANFLLAGVFKSIHSSLPSFVEATSQSDELKIPRRVSFCPIGYLRLHDTPGTRMEIRTWRSAIADLKPPPPGAPSGALGEGTPGWVWRCDAAISRYSPKCL